MMCSTRPDAEIRNHIQTSKDVGLGWWMNMLTEQMGRSGRCQ